MHPLTMIVGFVLGVRGLCSQNKVNNETHKKIPNSHSMRCLKCGQTYDSSWKVCLQCRILLEKIAQKDKDNSK